MSDHRPAAARLSEALGHRRPTIALVLGSGLGALAEGIEDAVALAYAEIPGLPVSTVAGHSGRFVAGTLAGREVLCMEGRLHAYEGHAMADLALPIRAMRAAGTETLVLSNAAGSLHESMPPGSLMAITDHINWSGASPLIGPNDDEVGPRFVDMANAYDGELRARLHEVAASEGIDLSEGVYLWYPGPTFETPAEIRAMRVLGADAVGMSTVPECVAARHCGLRVVAVSAITNLAAGMSAQALSHEHTLAQSRSISDRFCRLIERFVASTATR